MKIPLSHPGSKSLSVSSAGGLSALLRSKSMSNAVAINIMQPITDPRQLRLALKYASVWGSKLGWTIGGGEGARADAKLLAIHHILIKSQGGELHMQRMGDMELLQPGCTPLGKAMIQVVVKDPIPPSLPSNIYYFQASIDHVGNELPDFQTIHFARPARVYLFLPSINKEPKWLRDKFTKYRDQVSGNHVGVRGHWPTPTAFKLMLAAALKHRDYVDQRLMVWESSKVYQPTEELVLGGPGAHEFGDTIFIVGARVEEEKPADPSKPEMVNGHAHPHGSPFGGVLYQGKDGPSAEMLISRLVKAIKRDRLDDAKSLISSAAWLQARPSWEAVTFLPAGERYHLIVDLAAHNHNLPILCLLVDRCGCALGFRALKFLVRHWDEVPAGYDSAELIMLRYLRRHPGPIAIMSAFLVAMRAELRTSVNTSTALKSAVANFVVLQGLLLVQLQEAYHRAAAAVASNSASLQQKSLPPLEEVLEPVTAPLTLSDFSPLRIAFLEGDHAFMASQIVEGYTRERWIGIEYTQLTQKDHQKSMSGLDPTMVFVMFENIGFVGNAAQGSMMMIGRLLHLMTMTTSAFFRSPRGRWCMKLQSSVVFVVLFQLMLFNTNTKDNMRVFNIHILFQIWLAGNLAEAGSVILLRHSASAGKFAMSQPMELAGTVSDAILLVTGILTMLADHGKLHLGTVALDALYMVKAGLAFVVWARMLTIMIPLYRALGPLMRTMSQMFTEIVAFALPFLCVTGAFATTLHVVANEVDAYSTFQGTVLLLFSAWLGNFTFGDFDDVSDHKRLYCIVVLVLYQVLATILLANLLIAIITYQYRPDTVRAQSLFDLAETVDRYRFQVKHHMLCSPFNLIILAFFWLPSAKVRKLAPFAYFKFGMMPLDGLSYATPDHQLVPAGRDELPHLCYLLVFHPLIMVAGNALLYLHAPYSILYFAWVGHKRLLDEYNNKPLPSARQHLSSHNMVSRKSLLVRVSSMMPSLDGRGSNPGIGDGSSGGATAYAQGLMHDLGLTMDDMSNEDQPGSATAAQGLKGAGVATDEFGEALLGWRLALRAVRNAIASFFWFLAMLALGFIVYVVVVGLLVITFIGTINAWVGHICMSLFRIGYGIWVGVCDLGAAFGCFCGPRKRAAPTGSGWKGGGGGNGRRRTSRSLHANDTVGGVGGSDSGGGVNVLSRMSSGMAEGSGGSGRFQREEVENAWQVLAKQSRSRALKGAYLTPSVIQAAIIKCYRKQQHIKQAIEAADTTGRSQDAHLNQGARLGRTPTLARMPSLHHSKSGVNIALGVGGGKERRKSVVLLNRAPSHVHHVSMSTSNSPQRHNLHHRENHGEDDDSEATLKYLSSRSGIGGRSQRWGSGEGDEHANSSKRVHGGGSCEPVGDSSRTPRMDGGRRGASFSNQHNQGDGSGSGRADVKVNVNVVPLPAALHVYDGVAAAHAPIFNSGSSMTARRRGSGGEPGSPGGVAFAAAVTFSGSDQHEGSIGKDGTGPNAVLRLSDHRGGAGLTGSGSERNAAVLNMPELTRPPPAIPDAARGITDHTSATSSQGRLRHTVLATSMDRAASEGGGGAATRFAPATMPACSPRPVSELRNSAAGDSPVISLQDSRHADTAGGEAAASAPLPAVGGAGGSNAAGTAKAGMGIDMSIKRGNHEDSATLEVSMSGSQLSPRWPIQGRLATAAVESNEGLGSERELLVGSRVVRSDAARLERAGEAGNGQLPGSLVLSRGRLAGAK